jgi:hypothetical protein
MIKKKKWFDLKDYVTLFVIKSSSRGDAVAQFLMVLPMGQDKNNHGIYTSKGEKLIPMEPDFEEKILGDIVRQLKIYSKAIPAKIAAHESAIRKENRLEKKLHKVINELAV